MCVQMANALARARLRLWSCKKISGLRRRGRASAVWANVLWDSPARQRTTCVQLSAGPALMVLLDMSGIARKGEKRF